MNLEQFKNRNKNDFSGIIIIDDPYPIYSHLKNKRTTPKGIYGIRRRQKIAFYFDRMFGKRLK